MNVNAKKSFHFFKSDFERVDAHVIDALEYEELPELTDEMLARAVISQPSDEVDLPLSIIQSFKIRAAQLGVDARTLIIQTLERELARPIS